MQATCPDSKTGFLAATAEIELPEQVTVPLFVYWSALCKQTDLSFLLGQTWLLSVCDLAGQRLERKVKVVMFSYTNCVGCSCSYIHFLDLLSGEYFSVGVCNKVWV